VGGRQRVTKPLGLARAERVGDRRAGRQGCLVRLGACDLLPALRNRDPGRNASSQSEDAISLNPYNFNSEEVGGYRLLCVAETGHISKKCDNRPE
jgi:hypothetical protein